MSPEKFFERLLAHRSEAKLIIGFVDKIGQLSPQLITLNGQSFDLAVCNAILQFSRPGPISWIGPKLSLGGGAVGCARLEPSYP
jgi:hypothetical protein